MAGFTYKSYNFVDKDPIIDEIRTVYQDSGVNYKWLEDNSGVTSSTLSAWFSGKTKKPQAATINAVLRALGYKLGIVPHGEKVKVFPIMEQPVSRPTSVRHVVQMSKYKKTKRSHRG
jgi:transcriptional regulator with XRE-family HTH domain